MIIHDESKCPLVSVIIPVYNVKPYLSQCLHSVTGQTYRNLEILLLDDGSTDGSGALCDCFARQDPRILCVHLEHQGLSITRNTGLEMAHGRFLTFVDSDDWIDAGMIEKMARQALHTGADIVTVGVLFEYLGSAPIQISSCRDTLCGKEILPKYVSGAVREEVWNKLYRRECFAGIRFPENRNYEDISTTWRIMKKLSEAGGTITVLPDGFYHSRIRKSSITHDMSWQNLHDAWTACLERLEGLPEYTEKLIHRCFRMIGLMWTYYPSFSREEKRRARETIRNMTAFSRRHFRLVMKGRYPRYVKSICLVSQTAVLLPFYYLRRKHTQEANGRVLFD